MTPTIDVDAHPLLQRHGEFCHSMNVALGPIILPANASFSSVVRARVEKVFSSKNLNLSNTKRGDALELIFVDTLIKFGVDSSRIFDHVKVDRRLIELDVVVMPVSIHAPVICISLKTSIRERGMPIFDREAIAITLNLDNVWSEIAGKIGVSNGAPRIFYGVIAREQWDRPPQHAMDHAARYAAAAFNIDDDKLISIYDEANMAALLTTALLFVAEAAE